MNTMVVEANVRTNTWQRQRESFAIAPTADTDPYFTSEILAKIDRSLQQAKEGEVQRLTMDELDKRLGL